MCQGPGGSLSGGSAGQLRVESRGPRGAAHLLAVLRVGEVDEVVVVHLLGVNDVAVFFLAQIFGVDAIGPQELLIGHAESLADGLGDQLGLWGGEGAASEQHVARTGRLPAQCSHRPARASAQQLWTQWGKPSSQHLRGAHPSAAEYPSGPVLTAVSPRRARTKRSVKESRGKL